MKRATQRKRSTRETIVPETIAPEGAVIVNHLKWAGQFMNWDLLIYERANYWEACFFQSSERHEHVTGFSLKDARTKAEARIRLLELGSAGH